jgi:DedD protein
MEKKKLLLVAVSVGVFLVITISAAILIFTPKNTENAVAVSASGPVSPYAAGTPESIRTLEDPPETEGAGMQDNRTPVRTQPASVDAADMVRNADGIRGIQPPPQAQAIQENNFYINGDNPGESYTIEKSGEGSSARVVINVPKPSTAAVPDSSAAVRPAPRQGVVPARPAAGTQTGIKPATKSAEKKPAASARTYRDYWVQTGAFSARVRAEGAKETLASKGISSIIENRDIDGKTWYRVRVGPYTSENEASYWLSLVKSIDGFADSQIRQSIRN